MRDGGLTRPPTGWDGVIVGPAPEMASSGVADQKTSARWPVTTDGEDLRGHARGIGSNR
jgi:hypothetical protein